MYSKNLIRKVVFLLFILVASINAVIGAAPLQYQYYLLNPRISTGDLTVQSLSENNKITAGSTTLTVKQYSTDTLFVGSDIAQGMVVTGTGLFTLGGNIDATDLPVPGIFTGTTFVIPHYRDNHTYYLLSPSKDAQVTVTIAGIVTPVSLFKGQVYTFNAGSDNSISGIIQSDQPILVSHIAGNTLTRDAYPVPPASLEVWGVRNTNAVLGALEDNTTVTVYTSGNLSSTFTVNAGDRYTITTGSNTSQGRGAALHIIADKPVSTIQVADADGVEAAAFIDTPYLGTRYGIPVDSQYIAVVCTESNTTITLYDGANTPITQTCNRSGNFPGKAYFGVPDNVVSFSAGSYLESNHLVYITYEAALYDDERNSLGVKNSYYVLDAKTKNADVNVLSLANNNQIRAGTTNFFLNEFESAVLTAGSLTPGTEITGSAPFTLGGEVDATDLPVPGIFAGTSFVIPHYRDTHTYYLLSPYGDATATITIGATSTTLSLIKGVATTFSAGSDNTVSGLIQSNRPILVSHVAGTSLTTDAFPVPPASLELWGIRSSNVIMGALEDLTTVSVYTSDTQTTSYTLNAGDRRAISFGSNTSQGQGVAMHLVADKPISAIQVADSDGSEATAFFDTPYLATKYGIPVDSQYVAAICTQVNTMITLQDGANTPVAQSCTSDGLYPGKIYFGVPDNVVSFSAGTSLISDKPIYAIYEAALTDDEHNLLGFNVADSRPVAPVLNSLSTVTRNNAFTVTGTAQADDTINIYLDGVLLQTITAGVAGNYAASITLAEGNHEIYTSVANGQGESMPSAISNISYIPADRIEYYLVDPQTAISQLSIISMADNNQIYVGSNQYTLNNGETLNVPALSLKQGDIVWGSQPFSIGGDADATDTPVPAALSGTLFAIPHQRDEHKYYIFSPEGVASVNITIGTASPVQITVPAKTVIEFDAGSQNNIAGILSSNIPVVVTHQGHIAGTSLRDIYVVPPASAEIWGVKSAGAYLAATQDNTTVTVYSSDQTQSVYSLNAGEIQTLTVGNGAWEGAAAALHVVADKPVAAIQQADSDGSETTAFWQNTYYAKNFILPVDTQYVSVVCDQVDTLITLTDAATSNSTQLPCTANGGYPGKAYFGSTTDGINLSAYSTISSNNPIYLYFESAANNDEHNLYGFTFQSLLPPPILNAGISPTNDNPYLITGKASANSTVDIYVAGALQQQATGSATDGSFSVSVYLYDGLNSIYAVENDGTNVSSASNVIKVQYDNVIDRNNLPTNISVNTVWTAGSSYQPYVISSTVTVDQNKSLVIQEGATLHFNAGAELIVNGELIIVGSNGLPVYFTSSDANPYKGIWAGVTITSTSTKVVIDNLIIEYGNECLKFDNSGNVGLVTNTAIKNCSTGVRVNYDASPQIINNNEITLNSTGIYVLGSWNAALDPQPIVMNNRIYSNSSYNYYSKQFGDSSRLNATENWWGTDDPNSISALIYDNTDYTGSYYPVVDYGPYKVSDTGPLVDANFLNGPLTGNKTLVDNGKPYYITGYVEVPENITLTVLPGVKMKFIDTSLVVNGTLAINGSATNKVEITSVNVAPKKGDWSGITIYNTSVNSVIDYAVISYTKYAAISVFGATNTTISNSDIIANEQYGIRFQSGATGLIDNNVISDNTTGIYLLDANPQIINNEISSNVAGIRAKNSSSLIDNNLITANFNYGFLVEGSSTLSITNNAVISNFGTGIYIAGPIAQPAFNNNDIYNNALQSNPLDVTIVGYGAGSGITLDFTNNWWGTVSPDFNTLITYSATAVSVNTSLALAANAIQYSITNVVQSADIVRPAKNEVINLQFDISKAATVTFSVYERINVAANTAVAPVYSKQKIVPNAGAYSFVWNGKDTQDNFIKDDAYIYKIYIDSGDWKDKYAPALQAQNFTSIYNPAFVSIDVPANELFNQRIYFNAPRTVTAILTPDNGAPITLVSDQAYDITDTNIIWDGRRPDGSPVLNTAYTFAFTEDMFATKNVIFVRGTRPDITGEDYQVGEDQPYIEVKSDPYLIQHSYDQVSKISFYVDQDSMVEVKLLPPGIYDPANSSATILMPNQLLNAESAGTPILHSFIWRGYDAAAAAPDTNNILVSQEGLYTFTITATSIATGLSTLYRGSLNLYQ